MAIPHAAPGDIIKAQPLGAAIADTPSHALIKGRQLEVLRVVLPTGKDMPPHHVAGDVTVYCVEGVIEVAMAGRRQQLHAGDLLFLNAHETHALTALQDASALVTISLPAKETDEALKPQSLNTGA